MDRKFRIFLLEDDLDLANLNKRLLKRNGYEVLIANTITDARMSWQEFQPDLLVLDLNLPDGDGLQFCQEVRLESNVPVVFLTGNSSLSSKVSGLGGGGDYYLTKPFEKEELLVVIESLLRRAFSSTTSNQEQYLTCGVLKLDLNEGKVFIQDDEVLLTSKEFMILKFLLQNKDKDLTYEEIYEAVWGSPMFSDSRALRKQISRLKLKLEEEKYEDFSIITTHGKGYKLTSS